MLLFYPFLQTTTTLAKKSKHTNERFQSLNSLIPEKLIDDITEDIEGMAETVEEKNPQEG